MIIIPFANRYLPPPTSGAKHWPKPSPRTPRHPVINPKPIRRSATRSITPTSCRIPKRRSAACSTRSKRSSSPAPRRPLMPLRASPSTCSTILPSCSGCNRSLGTLKAHRQGRRAGKIWSNSRISQACCSKGCGSPTVSSCAHPGLRPIGSSSIKTLIFLPAYV